MKRFGIAIMRGPRFPDGVGIVVQFDEDRHLVMSTRDAQKLADGLALTVREAEELLTKDEQ